MDVTGKQNHGKGQEKEVIGRKGWNGISKFYFTYLKNVSFPFKSK